jgi:aminoglycoside 3-N-acetyltransferase
MTIMVSQLSADLEALGVRRGDLLLVHSAFRSVGTRDPELLIAALCDALGEAGTLLMPALTWNQQPHEIHDARSTPGCVGFLPEYFRMRDGTRRSLHPTHSVCAIGARADDLLGEHFRDETPCGPHSPFNKLLHQGGKILMLGCGLGPNTTMHAIEEHVLPPYVFGDPLVYTITDLEGRTFQKQYITHGFDGIIQRYDRVADLLGPPHLRRGPVGAAASYLIDAPALFEMAMAALSQNPFAFVDQEAEKPDV